MKKLLFIFLLIILSINLFAGEIISKYKKGYLEREGNLLICHIEGTPEEMGEQQGILLKDMINANINKINSIEELKDPMKNAFARMTLLNIFKKQEKYIPPRYLEELQAMAKAANVDYNALRDVNMIPELFHCSGFALWNKATKNKDLYHGRILDYGVWGLQENAVVIVAKPKGFNSFVNVTYAGFIGSVTGMNSKQLGFGEMGGNGEGKYDGEPFSFLFRRAMEEANTLDDVKKIFTETKRTCEYYYVFSDAKTKDATACYATPETIEFTKELDAKKIYSNPMEDVVVISSGDRFNLLTERIKNLYGKITPQDCLEIMKQPVSMKSNLHTVLMNPKKGEIWVSNAGPNGEPASEREYTYYKINWKK